LVNKPSTGQLTIIGSIDDMLVQGQKSTNNFSLQRGIIDTAASECPFCRLIRNQNGSAFDIKLQ